MIVKNNGSTKTTLSSNAEKKSKCIYAFFLLFFSHFIIGILSIIIISIIIILIALFFGSIMFTYVMRSYGYSFWFIGLCLLIFILVLRKTKALNKIVFALWT